MPQAQSYLSPSDRARIEAELRQIRARRAATSDLPVGDPRFYRPPEVDIDEGQLRAREAHLHGVLKRETAPKLDPSQRNAAYLEFKGLVREWETNALTQYDQGLGYPEIMKKNGEDHVRDFERSKQKCMAWEMAGRGVYVGHRLKQLAGVLDPENPNLRNLENYRRRK